VSIATLKIFHLADRLKPVDVSGQHIDIVGSASKH
jgi:hypothetical protein